MNPVHIFVEAALAEVGQPYIWGGKGDKLWTPSGLVGNPYARPVEEGRSLHIFDCAGLVTWARWKATGYDQRGAWSAQTMLDGLSPLTLDVGPSARLRLYGQGHHATHVAVLLGFIDGRPLVVEAAGGDQSTTTVLAARERGAMVRCGFERRSDLIGERPLPLGRNP